MSNSTIRSSNDFKTGVYRTSEAIRQSTNTFITPSIIIKVLLWFGSNILVEPNTSEFSRLV